MTDLANFDLNTLNSRDLCIKAIYGRNLYPITDFCQPLSLGYNILAYLSGANTVPLHYNGCSKHCQIAIYGRN
jgi:hypothetical protein